MGAKLAPRWGYVGQLGAQSGQLGAILGAILAHLGHLGANIKENGEKTKNIKKPMVFFYVFCFFYRFLLISLQDGLDVARWLPKWRQVGHFGGQVGQHSPILAPTWRPCSLKLGSWDPS